MQSSPDGDGEVPVNALEMVLLDAGDRIGNELRHHAVNRAAIVAAVSHHSLQRGDVSGIAQQLVARLEVIVEARVRSRKIIRLIHIRHLMQAAPFIAWRQRIDGMKERIVVLSANGGCRKKDEKNDSGPAQYLDNHKREQANLITTSSGWRVGNAIAGFRVAIAVARDIGDIRVAGPFSQDAFLVKSVSFQEPG